ncbi:MAG: efflux RND transporter periplasmic adaptor subunit [Pseudomonadota bacterium]
MYGGKVEIGGQNNTESQAVASDADGAQAPDAEPANKTELFRVNIVKLAIEQRRQTVNVRGRTKADATIPVRSETAGILEQRMVERGDRVSKGDLVCIVDRGARQAAVESAMAQLDQTTAEYEANKNLLEKGFATDTQIRRLRFGKNAAQAEVDHAKIELSRTEIRANVAGIVQDPIAEVGDVLAIGAACITVVDSDPMYFTGQISEREVGSVETGMKANISLVTGETLVGQLNYIAPSADPKTRTFAIEIRLDPTDQSIRDGITASAFINLPLTQSIRVRPSWLTLADSGEVGVKVLDEENRVQFVPVQILSQSNEGFWVSGVNAGERIITLGQEYVTSGEVVEPVEQTLKTSEVQQ